MTENNYPGILERVKAIAVDTVVTCIMMFIAYLVFSLFESAPVEARMIAFVFIVLLYDPIFTSLFGGTVGHFFIGIRVKRESNEQKNILFPLAIPRFIVKYMFGWISLLAVLFNKKRRAIHDYVVGSVVIYAKSKEDNELDDNSLIKK